jgi:hypothetical protein
MNIRVNYFTAQQIFIASTGTSFGAVTSFVEFLNTFWGQGLYFPFNGMHNQCIVSWNCYDFPTALYHGGIRLFTLQAYTMTTAPRNQVIQKNWNSIALAENTRKHSAFHASDQNLKAVWG